MEEARNHTGEQFDEQEYKEYLSAYDNLTRLNNYIKQRHESTCDYSDIKFDDISIIKHLWEKNRIHHERTSDHFGALYHSLCFEERIAGFGTFPQDKLKITVAKLDGEYVGYCISTITDAAGELQSLHVDERFRCAGIGKQLVMQHLDWMRQSNCSTIGVTVSQENEKTINFYKKLGFYPNTLYMQMK